MALPISQSQAQQAGLWLRNNFEAQIIEGIAGTFLSVEIVCAVACQETAYKWLNWLNKYDAQTIIERCVFDASGEPEFPQSPRSAFPRNRDEFKAHYGVDFLNMLVEEGNKTRRMQGYYDSPFLYKGYGIFQYDIQAVTTDRDFFEQKQWYSFSECLNKFVQEMNSKAAVQSNLHDIIRCYNGSGAAAQVYADNVMQYADWV